jgi:hypothetical protein
MKFKSCAVVNSLCITRIADFFCLKAETSFSNEKKGCSLEGHPWLNKFFGFLL